MHYVILLYAISNISLLITFYSPLAGKYPLGKYFSSPDASILKKNETKTKGINMNFMILLINAGSWLKKVASKVCTVFGGSSLD